MYLWSYCVDLGMQDVCMDYKRLRKGKNQYERKSWKLELKLPYFTLYEYLSNTDSSDKVGVPLGQQIGPNLKHVEAMYLIWMENIKSRTHDHPFDGPTVMSDNQLTTESLKRWKVHKDHWSNPISLRHLFHLPPLVRSMIWVPKTLLLITYLLWRSKKNIKQKPQCHHFVI